MKTKNLVLIALFAALIAIFSWISIPTAVPFTLQTFAVALTLFLLGGKNGTLAILVYLLLGAIGLPVFANFQGGFDKFFNATGGYKLGFLVMGLIYWLMEKNPKLRLPAQVFGLLALYLMGSLWFAQVFVNKEGAKIGWLASLSLTVFPFIISDFVKLFLAYLLAKRLEPVMAR